MSNSNLAVQFAYQNVLERHHLARTFAILQDPQCDLLRHMPTAERTEVREQLKGMVIATDFANHNSTINQFKAMLGTHDHAHGGPPAARTRQEVEASPGKQLFTEDGTLMAADEKLLILQMAIKTADLGYLSKGTDYCLTWTSRVLEEFFAQGDQEKLLGLPVSQGMDRETVNIPKGQLGFYTFVIHPLYEAWDLLVSFRDQIGNLSLMEGHWNAEQEEETRKGTDTTWSMKRRKSIPSLTPPT
jgi:hypothetical protein